MAVTLAAGRVGVAEGAGAVAAGGTAGVKVWAGCGDVSWEHARADSHKHIDSSKSK